MPRAKTSPTKKSKKLISNKRFSLTKLQIAFIALIISIVGLIVVYKSHAATPWAATAAVYGCPLTGYGVPAGSVQLGSSGPCVKLLQAGLNLGYQTHITVDGQFGTLTQAAVTWILGSGTVNSNGWVKVATAYNQSYPIYGSLPQSATYQASAAPMVSRGACIPEKYLNFNGAYSSGNVCLWLTGTTTTQFFQYGPYANMAILPGQHGLHVCYDYYSHAGANANSTGTFSVFNDVVYHPGSDTITVGGVTQNVVNSPVTSDPNHLGALTMQAHCTDYPMAVAYYPKLEFRLRINGSNPTPGSLDLWRTRVNVY